MANRILLETGDVLLKEDGDALLLEDAMGTSDAAILPSLAACIARPIEVDQEEP